MNRYINAMPFCMHIDFSLSSISQITRRILKSGILWRDTMSIFACFMLCALRKMKNTSQKESKLIFTILFFYEINYENKYKKFRFLTLFLDKLMNFVIYYFSYRSSCLHKDSYMAQRKERTLGYEGRYRRTLSPSGLGSNNNNSKSSLTDTSSPSPSTASTDSMVGGGTTRSMTNLGVSGGGGSGKLDSTLSPAGRFKCM